MVEITLEKALEGKIDTNDHYLSLYRDGTTVFYVGRSTSPLQRLLEHLGRGDYCNSPSPLGKLINDHLPLSLSWTLLLLTVADCEPIVRLLRAEYYGWYLQQMQRRLAREAAEVAEEALIDHFQPCLNIVGNRATRPLPAKYRKDSPPAGGAWRGEIVAR